MALSHGVHNAACARLFVLVVIAEVLSAGSTEPASGVSLSEAQRQGSNKSVEDVSDGAIRPLCVVKANRCFDMQLSALEPLNFFVPAGSAAGLRNGSVEIVVTRFGDNVQWLDAFPHINVTLYNRGGPDTLLPMPRPNLKIVAQANTGREDDGMLKYIYDNYDHLPDRVIFLQGWPLAHCQGIVAAVKQAILSQEPLYPISRVMYQYFVSQDDRLRKLGYEVSDSSDGETQFLELCSSLLNGVACPRTMWVAEGGQWAVDRASIRRIPKVAYHTALRLGEGWRDKLRGLVLEALWSTLWGGHDYEPTSHRTSTLLSGHIGLMQLSSKPSDALGPDVSAAVHDIREAEGNYCLFTDDESIVYSCEDRMAFCELHHRTAGTQQLTFEEERPRFQLGQQSQQPGKLEMVANLGVPLLAGPGLFMKADSDSRITLGHLPVRDGAWNVAFSNVSAQPLTATIWLNATKGSSRRYLGCNVTSAKAILQPDKVEWIVSPANDGYMFLRQPDGDALHSGSEAGNASEVLCIPPSPDARTFRSTIHLAVLARAVHGS